MRYMLAKLFDVLYAETRHFILLTAELDSFSCQGFRRAEKE